MKPLVRLMGVADFLSAFALLFAASLPLGIAWPLALYLIAKGGIFALMGNRVSLVDALCGLYLIASVRGLSFAPLGVLGCLFLLQKAVFSLA